MTSVAVAYRGTGTGVEIGSKDLTGEPTSALAKEPVREATNLLGLEVVTETILPEDAAETVSPPIISEEFEETIHQASLMRYAFGESHYRPIVAVSVPVSPDVGGDRVLNRGIKITVAISVISVIGLTLGIKIGLIGLYLGGAVFFVHLYEYWLETKRSIISPRYIVAGIVASLGLAISTLVAILAK